MKKYKLEDIQYQFPMAEVTKYHRVTYNHRNLWSHSSKILKVWNQAAGRALLPLKPVWENPPASSSSWSLPVIFGVLWLIDVTPISICIVTWLSSPCMSLFLYGHSYAGFWTPQMNSAWLYLQRSCFQIRSYSQVLRVRTSKYLLLGGGVYNSPITNGWATKPQNWADFLIQLWCSILGQVTPFHVRLMVWRTERSFYFLG